MSEPFDSGHGFARSLGALLMRIRPAPLSSFIKAALGVRRIVVETKEGKMWLDPASEFGQRMLALGTYEPGTISVLRQVLKPGGTFADVGANEGFFSLLASRIVGPAGRVLAVEPQQRLQEVLRRNFALNGAGNVTVTASAVSDAEGVAELNLAPSMNTGASSFTARTRYRLKRQSVPTETLAEIVRKWGVERVDLVKMDIEGWEYEAILGSRALFSERRVGAIVLELHDDHLRRRGLEAGRITGFLTECGYAHAAQFDALVFALP
jgi:FkbM family methyltransferase